MKRVLGLLLIVFMLATLITGCATAVTTTTAGPTTTAKSTTAAATTQSAASTTAATTTVSNMVGNMYKTGLPIVKDKVTIKMMAFKPDNVTYDLNQLPLVLEWEKKTNIDFVIDTVTAQDRVEKPNLAIATNNLPDVIQGSIAPDLVKNGAAGLYLTTEGLIKEWCPFTTKFFGEHPDFRKSMTAPDGHLYGFPKYFDTGEHNTQGLYLNSDWLAKVNKQVPTTTAEYADVLRAFKGKDLNGNGVADEYPLGFHSKTAVAYGNLFLWHGLPAYGMVYVDKNKKVQCGFTDPGYKRGVEYVNSLYADGLIDPECYTMDVQTYYAKTKKYTYGSIIIFAPYSAFGIDVSYADTKMVLVPPLKGPEGQQNWYWSPSNPVTNAASLVITKACKNPEIIARWCDYCAEDSMQVSQGLIGINLFKNDGPDAATYPWKLADPMPAWSHFTAESFLLVTKEMYQSMKPGAQSAQRRPRQAMYAPVVNYGAIFPTIMPTAEENKRISELLPDLQSYVDQTQTKWIMQGGVNAGWDAYVAQLKSMKLDELMAIYQTQYDRYMKQ